MSHPRFGRKNWLFYWSERGGRTGAVLHSVLASAKRRGLNEFDYLCDVLDLLPDKWQPKMSSRGRKANGTPRKGQETGMPE